jgi:acetyltransferase-like isoleucine patch superfamily enzyme
MSIARTGRAYALMRGIRNRAIIAAKRLRHVHPTAYVHPSSKVSSDLRAGPYAFIGKRCAVSSLVTIGRYSMLAPNVSIIGDDHNWNEPGVPIQFSGRPSQERTVIEDDVWIGQGAMVRRGVTVGRGSIVGAGAIVATSIPEYEIWAGVPARRVRARFRDLGACTQHDKMLAGALVTPRFVEPRRRYLALREV